MAASLVARTGGLSRILPRNCRVSCLSSVHCSRVFNPSPDSRDSQAHSTVRRYLSTVPKVKEDGGVKIPGSKLTEKDGWRKVYVGPLAHTIKRVKIFSLTTAACCIIGSPVLVFFGKASVPLMGKMAISFLCLGAGTVTTGLLHWFSRSYVKEMHFNPQAGLFSVTRLSLFARPVETVFPLEDVKIVNGATTTFEADSKSYFIHEELPQAQQVLQFIQDMHQIMEKK